MGTMEFSEERIYVSVRLRPLNEKELLRNDVSDWECINDNTIVYKDATPISASERFMYPTVYTFDKVFRTDCSTREVYEQGAKDIALSVVNGINSSVFAYGQTSSGKTFTMTGITEYAIADIYKYKQKHPERDFLLKFSAMEIYNESVRDLLNTDSPPLRVLDDPDRGTIVEKLSEETIIDWNHAIQLLSVCEAQRQNGETSLNEMSSRSHQIIRLTVESTSRDFSKKNNPSTLTATVNFVDLAGSERASQSLSAGTRLKEGCHINRSLLTLGTVIRKLSKGRNGHIPFRDSKLTRILQSSLGGNARTAIICTLSPARSHVEQSRNTLLFASCAKEVTTNAQVNVVVSEKALIKQLQKEIVRLESQVRTSDSTFASANYSALLSEKDFQIGKLEKEIKELILQRDIAQSQVRDLLQMLGNDEQSVLRVGFGQYPHLRIQKSPESGMQEQEASIVADPQSLEIDSRTYSDVNSRTSSEDHFAKIPFYDDCNTFPRILVNCSNFSEDDSFHAWEDVDIQSNETSEEHCRVVRCIDTEETINPGSFKSNDLHSEEDAVFPVIRLNVNGNGNGQGSMSSTPHLAKNEELISLSQGNNNGQEADRRIGSVVMENELISPVFNDEKEGRSINFLDMRSLEKLSLTHNLGAGSKGLKLTRSRSCTASVSGDYASPLSGIVDSGENVSTWSKGETDCFSIKTSPINYCSNMENSSRKDPHCSAETSIDSTAEDVVCRSSNKTQNDELLSMDIETNTNPVKEETESKEIESLRKNVKDVGLDPIEEEFRGLPSWPTEFKRLQKEIIELWHDCNVSLVHRTYFFLLFQGDSLDAIYMEVELRRMKFLKDKFSRGEKTFINGRCLTLTSSAKDLAQERRKLSKEMEKKLSEQERESLFLKWDIGLNTKLRKLQLTHRLWCNTEDMNHIYDSAYLVARLVGLIESGQPTKEMFGVNFTPKQSSRTYTFKRSLISIL